MRTVQQWLIVVVTALISCIPAHASQYAQLRADMESACPIAWEDLGVAINSALPSGDLWNNDVPDRDAFVAQYTANNPGLTPGEVQTAADDLTTVATECASHRVALLDELLNQTPSDVSQALTNAGDSSILDNANGNRWMTGDVRVTGRLSAAGGWVFLTGQTIGSPTSTADLQGDEYRNLFELAKNWAPNSGSENWHNDELVTLPDMRGRGLYGADNMGGQSANVLADSAADQIGGSFGQEEVTLTTNELPSHNHTMQNAGNHSHSMSFKSSHSHKTHALNNWVYVNPTGSTSSWASPQWSSSGTNSWSAGGHDHNINSNGNHSHTINNTGSGAPVNTVSPGIVFNVEMKL